MRIDIKNILSKFFAPATLIGGLQITNSAIRYLELKRDGGVAKRAGLRLPPGIIENGNVKDKENFIAALKAVRVQIGLSSSKNVNVILTIPTGDVYAQAFLIPKVGEENLTETVDLNIRMISPRPLENSYYSWMAVGGEDKNSNQLEILGVIAPKETINTMSACLEEAGFGIAAIEFSSLSMARMLYDYNSVKKDSPSLLIKLNQEGLIFMILRNGALYFDFFHSWGKLRESGRGISFDAIKETIGSESHRVLNFYANRWNDQIKNIVLVSPVFVQEIAEFLKDAYPSFDIGVFSSDQDSFHSVKGAALRGLSPRLSDQGINLMNPKSFSAFWRDEIINFIRIWRDLAVIALLFVAVVFSVSDLFLRSKESVSNAGRPAELTAADMSELNDLELKAENFNAEISALNHLLGLSPEIAPLIKEINAAIGPGIIVNRLSAQSSTKTGSLDGSSEDQTSIFGLRDALAKLPGLYDIDLPFPSLVAQSNGQISFSLSFKFK